MKRVAILAPTGMLGSQVYNVLKDSCQLVLLYRSEDTLRTLDRGYGSVKKQTKIRIDLEEVYQQFVLSKGLSVDNPLLSLDVDMVINCSGIIKPYANVNPHLTFFINSAIPHLLSSAYKERFLQITTDCVFSGKEGAPYNEQAGHSPTDLYGLTKSLGEPKDSSLVLRTSIIGPEISHFMSLVEWFKRQKKVNGFTNHLWNGITTKQFGIICKNLLSDRKKFPKTGVFHIFSQDISKYNLLLLLKKKYNSNCQITPVESEPIDRRLSTIFNLNSLLGMPSLEDQINSL